MQKRVFYHFLDLFTKNYQTVILFSFYLFKCFKSAKSATLMRNSQKFIHQFYYTIHLPKMQRNMKNIPNIFQILKDADLSQVAPYLKTGIFEFKTNWICVYRAR